MIPDKLLKAFKSNQSHDIYLKVPGAYIKSIYGGETSMIVEVIDSEGRRSNIEAANITSIKKPRK